LPDIVSSVCLSNHFCFCTIFHTGGGLIVDMCSW
jgi:hypothetical protein